MNFGILNHIGIHEPWSIHPEYAQTYYPLLLGLLRGDSQKGESEDHSTARKLNQTYFLSQDNLDDDDFDPEMNQELSQAPEGSVAVVSLNGPVIKYSQFCGPRGTMDIANDLKKIDSNPNYVGVVFKIESGGGQVYAIKPITDVLDQMKKPVVVLAGNYLASAAYAIAVHTKEIVADHPKSIIGSIGTMMSFQDVRPYFESQGVKFHEFYATKSTLKNKRTNEALKGNYNPIINDRLDPINEDFILDVKTQRSGRIADNEAIFSGDDFFASQAKDLGMIDHLGDMAFAVQRVRELSRQKDNKQAQSQNNTDMKFAHLAALAANQAPTQEQIDLANGDLTTEGITNVTLVPENFITESASVTAENTRLTEELATAQASLQTANSSLEEANSRISELEAKVDDFGKNAGAAHSTATGEDVPPGEGEDDTEAILNSLPHNQKADRILG